MHPDFDVREGSEPALDGLSEADAARLLAAFGPNVVESRPPRNVLQVALGTLREPMFLFLLAAAAIYFFIGSLGEALFLVFGASITIGLVVVQEVRSERSLDALRELAQPFARVIRAGVARRIAARDLVPGDLVLVGEGERVPADGELVGVEPVTIDESMLTGESVPVTKAGGGLPPAEHSNRVFAGTLVTRGQGTARISATGAATSLGKIGASLRGISIEQTPLQRTSAKLIARLGIVAVGFCFLVFVIYGLLRQDWLEGALLAITLAIALIPEEFPMVLAIFMALGSWRLAQGRVLVRRASVIETLGSATILCVDKTGTLTENLMRVARLWTAGAWLPVEEGKPIDGGAHRLIAVGALASLHRGTDPMDRAVRDAASRSGAMLEGIDAAKPVSTYHLRAKLLAFIQIYRTSAGESFAAAKGAPEAIFRLCALPPGERKEAEAAVETMAAAGLRVLGVASRADASAIGDGGDGLTYVFEGLIGFIDPVRPEVPAALASARRAGIAVAMITGDYPLTALEIARQAGIDVSAGILIGDEIDAMTERDLRKRVEDVRVFARVLPEQKLRLVSALKANGAVVAMTGDGVNDAPAIESAHIGIAMGERGTDVAREAADVVLLDDSFASIIDGVRLGRRIFTNLRKALVYVTAAHIPTAVLALSPIVLGLPPILLPMHVVLVELVIDPVCSIVFEAEPSHRSAMERPPRPRDEGLFGRPELFLAILQGGVNALAVLALFVVALALDVPEAQARGMAFAALVGANLVLAFSDSAETGSAFFDRHRIAFWLIGATAAAILIAIFFVPALSAIFKVEVPSLPAATAAAATALVAGGWFGMLRRLGIVGRRGLTRR